MESFLFNGDTFLVNGKYVINLSRWVKNDRFIIFV